MDTLEMTNDGRHHFFMRVMVWNMRWMTRYAGFIARPIVRVYGNNEIIACGLRNEDNSVAIIYTPKTGHRNHEVLLREGRQWVHETSNTMENFSGSVVSRLSLPRAQNGMRYKMVGVTANGRRLSSPAITVKPATIYDSTLLEIEATTPRNVLFAWPRAETHDPMIYFLAVEDETGKNTHVAIYTRETFWCYPKTKTHRTPWAPLNLLPSIW
ncbi:hypothetical protein NZD89_20765 [Alicyclobacillus fastidiosus]|uniref:Uncharacterized protein n=1 Tax=Alicyclobacillus fastidiosus TaxID=392011 RepID=A0ABY6ZEX8_9BACL|nr:hypothetical protein [Alicyclobacillus fastidiosus]WAH40709.1 hypothetical protein NZD89_20765 [Alicyclobacillus fastidiosus]GMA62180.1 hypothetical protein GCM10025859_26200 [Alicyclobacillus fastidiosus]